MTKIDFQRHDVFFQAFFFPPFYGGGIEKLESDINALITTFANHKDQILTLIEKYTGYTWSQETVPVFLIPKTPVISYSFTRLNLVNGLAGIVQKVGMGAFRDLHIFIHELVHVNCRQQDFYEKYTDNNLKELVADLVTLYVIRDLFGTDSEYEKDFFDFLQNTNDKNKVKYNYLHEYKDKWDLKDKQIASYLETFKVI
jgi:hypothetical protein